MNDRCMRIIIWFSFSIVSIKFVFTRTMLHKGWRRLLESLSHQQHSRLARGKWSRCWWRPSRVLHDPQRAIVLINFQTCLNTYQSRRIRYKLNKLSSYICATWSYAKFIVESFVGNDYCLLLLQSVSVLSPRTWVVHTNLHWAPHWNMEKGKEMKTRGNKLVASKLDVARSWATKYGTKCEDMLYQ